MQTTFRVYLFVFSVCCIFSTACAQEDKSKRPSPPAEAKGKIGSAEVVINYSQPGVKDREIWGALVPYGDVWRTGANEATTFEVSEDVMIEGQKLPAGTYGLFTIPNEDEWTIIFNTDSKQWGAYDYDESKDVLRVKVKPTESEEFTERMTFEVDKEKVDYMWENLQLSFKVEPAS